MRMLHYGLFPGLLFFIISMPFKINAQNIADQVVITRTDYGVPHIDAKNIEAAGYAMGYIQMEDYGPTVVNGLVRARGEWAEYHNMDGEALRRQIDKDATHRLGYNKAVATFHRLDQQTRELITGYAAGVNRYISLHKKEFPDWVKPDFSRVDVHAAEIGAHDDIPLKRFIKKQKEKDQKTGAFNPSTWITPWTRIALHARKDNPDVGSNAWALAPSRTKSGKAILLRNPHLYWSAGYYEAQITVDGMFDFYGDFRIGHPLGVVGGFNRYLGWATTNNNPDLKEIYALKKDTAHPQSYLLDGSVHRLEKTTVSVAYREGDHIAHTQRTFYFTPYGPVIYRNNNEIFILKSVKEGAYRNDRQYLRMMQAKNLAQWKDAMRIQGLYNSNLTYADREGHIFYVWNAATPLLPYEKRDRRGIIHVTKSAQIWTDLYPWNKLPHLLNPKGGYIHNENDPFYYTNLNEVFDEDDFPGNFPKPKLDLRSQLSIQLIQGSDKLSLEEVIDRKNTLKMLLADRVKKDLVQAVLDTHPEGEMKKAIQVIQDWDNTVSKDSRGGILFKMWWVKYVRVANGGHPVPPTPASVDFSAPADALFAVPWSEKDPIHTPYGLADKKGAVKAFRQAVQVCKEKYGKIDIPWGAVHRAKMGDQDYAVGGAPGAFGCFRVLWYSKDQEDKKKMDAKGGDGWVLAVEFDEVPKAYSVLAYGESNRANSPYYANQLKMFVDKKMKPVYYTGKDIESHIKRRYHPGEEQKGEIKQ